MTPSSRRRLSTALFALALVVAGCDGSPTETTSPGPGDTDPTSTTTPARTDPEIETVVISDGEDHVVSGSDVQAAVHCEGGGMVGIEADESTVTIEGHCAGIDVSGDGNIVEADTVDGLDIGGHRNVVIAGPVDGLVIEGDGNIATLETVHNVDIKGDVNTATFTSGDPDITDEGADNIVGQE